MEARATPTTSPSSGVMGEAVYTSLTMGGYCLVLGACNMVGEPCGGHSECCSYTCLDGGTGFTSCAYLGGCRPYGELCRKDSDCCNDVMAGAPGVCEIFNVLVESLGACFSRRTHRGWQGITLGIAG